MKKINFIEKLVKENKITLTTPSDDICKAHIKKSDNSLKASELLLSKDLFEESISMAYYSMFHISQALFFKVGIKCENHSALIILLKELFEIENSSISFAKEERIDKQYYIDFNITKEDDKSLIELTRNFRSQIYIFIDELSNKEKEKFLEEFKNTYLKV